MLQRIYGISFPKASELEEYLNMLEEAKKRDHRKLGKELELLKKIKALLEDGKLAKNIELEDEDKCILYRVNDYEWDKVWDNGYSGKGYHNVSEVYENDDELRFVVLNKYDNSCLINEDNEVLFCAEENWDRIVWLEGREEFECGRSRYYSWDGELLRKED